MFCVKGDNICIYVCASCATWVVEEKDGIGIHKGNGALLAAGRA